MFSGMNHGQAVIPLRPLRNHFARTLVSWKRRVLRTAVAALHSHLTFQRRRRRFRVRLNFQPIFPYRTHGSALRARRPTLFFDGTRTTPNSARSILPCKRRFSFASSFDQKFSTQLLLLMILTLNRSTYRIRSRCLFLFLRTLHRVVAMTSSAHTRTAKQSAPWLPKRSHCRFNG